MYFKAYYLKSYMNETSIIKKPQLKEVFKSNLKSMLFVAQSHPQAYLMF